MAEHGAAHIGKNALADLVHQGGAKIASGGQHKGYHRRTDDRAVQQLRVLPAKPLINEIGKAAPHRQQRAGHHQQRQGGTGDAPAIGAEKRPEDAQKLGRGIGRAALAQRCALPVECRVGSGLE